MVQDIDLPGRKIFPMKNIMTKTYVKATLRLSAVYDEKKKFYH